MTTLEEVPNVTLEMVREQCERERRTAEFALIYRSSRDQYIRACYAEGNATLQELAKASGLSKQRIWQIVGEGKSEAMDGATWEGGKMGSGTLSEAIDSAESARNRRPGQIIGEGK